jgi:hypothetical protein
MLDTILFPDNTSAAALSASMTEASKAAPSLASTWQERFLLALRAFPIFYGKTLFLCLVPTLCCTAALSVGAWHAELMRTDTALRDVSGTFEDFENLAEVQSRTAIVVEILKSMLMRVAAASIVIVILCVITNTRDVIQVASVSYLPFVIVYLAGAPVRVLAKARGEVGIHNMIDSYPIRYGPLLVGTLLLFIRVGRQVGEKPLWWKTFIVFVVQYALASTLDTIWSDVGNWSDVKKTIVVTIVAPVVVEVALTICRCALRSVTLHHEAGSWAFNGCACFESPPGTQRATP